MLKQYLSLLSHQTLLYFFPSTIPTNGLYSRSEVVDKIWSRHFAAKQIEQRFGQLSDLQKDVLWGLLAYQKPIPLNVFLNLVPKSRMSDLEQAIEGLRLVFFVFAAKADPVEYGVFPELTDTLAKATVQDRKAAWGTRKKEPPKHSGHHMTIWNDITTLLLFAAKEKLKYTQKGFVSKRCLDELIANFQVQEDFTKVFENNYYLIESLPDRFRMLYDYALERNLIAVENDTAHITANGMTWLGWSQNGRINDFLWYVLQHRVQPSTDANNLYTVLQQFDQWTDIKHLLLVYRESDQHGNAVSVNKSPKSVAEFPVFLRALCYAGLIEFAWNGNQTKTYLRISACGRQYPGKLKEENAQLGVVVTPSMEVIVPPEISLRRRFQIGQFTNCPRFDQVYHWTINRTSVHEALERGLPLADMYAALKEPPNSSPVASSINDKIQEWSQELARLSFSNSFILEVHNQALMNELKAIPKISSFLGNEIRGYGFVLERQNYDALYATLKEIGYFPKAFREKTEVPEPDGKWDPSPSPLESTVANSGKKPEKRELIPLEKPKEPQLINIESKYGTKLKQLPGSEILQVLKYASIADKKIIIEYSGEPSESKPVRKILIVKQVNNNGKTPTFEALENGAYNSQRFAVDCIRKIAIKP